jgi:hypothetical protein
MTDGLMRKNSKGMETRQGGVVVFVQTGSLEMRCDEMTGSSIDRNTP